MCLLLSFPKPETPAPNPDRRYHLFGSPMRIAEEMDSRCKDNIGDTHVLDPQSRLHFRLPWRKAGLLKSFR